MSARPTAYSSGNPLRAGRAASWIGAAGGRCLSLAGRARDRAALPAGLSLSPQPVLRAGLDDWRVTPPPVAIASAAVWAVHASSCAWASVAARCAHEGGNEDGDE